MRVNAIVAQGYDSMFTAFKAAGFTMNGTSGWRSMEEQERLFAQAGANTAARPGYSNHQFGTAVDFSCSDPSGKVFAPNVPAREVETTSHL